MTKYQQWRKEWKENHEKAMECLSAVTNSKTFDRDWWEKYKEFSKKANHAYGVMRRCNYSEE